MGPLDLESSTLTTRPLQICNIWWWNKEVKWIFAVFILVIKAFLNPLNTNPTKWSNTLKKCVGNLLTNCLSVFDHFVNLAFKGLIELLHVNCATNPSKVTAKLVSLESSCKIKHTFSWYTQTQTLWGIWSNSLTFYGLKSQNSESPTSIFSCSDSVFSWTNHIQEKWYKNAQKWKK